MNKNDILSAALKSAEEQQIPQGIQPQPVPMGIRLGRGQLPDGRMAVVLMIATVTGESVYFLDGDTSKRIGTALVQAGTAAASGLLVP